MHCYFCVFRLVAKMLVFIKFSYNGTPVALKSALVVPLKGAAGRAETASLLFALLFNGAMFAIACSCGKEMVCESLRSEMRVIRKSNSSTGAASRPKMVGGSPPAIRFGRCCHAAGRLRDLAPGRTDAATRARRRPRRANFARPAATVANIDWPSSAAQRRAENEIVQIVERARALNLNALIAGGRARMRSIRPATSRGANT
jgi:hypothetical protein